MLALSEWDQSDCVREVLDAIHASFAVSQSHNPTSPPPIARRSEEQQKHSPPVSSWIPWIG